MPPSKMDSVASHAVRYENPVYGDAEEDLPADVAAAEDASPLRTLEGGVGPVVPGTPGRLDKPEPERQGTFTAVGRYRLANRVPDLRKAPKTLASAVPNLMSENIKYNPIFDQSGLLLKIPLLGWLMLGSQGLELARESSDPQRGLQNPRILHKWIQVPTAESYMILFASSVARVFLPHLTLFTTVIVILLSIGYNDLPLNGAEIMIQCIAVVGISFLILMSLIQSLCKRYIYYRLLRHGYIIDLRNYSGLQVFFSHDRIVVTVCCLALMGYDMFLVSLMTLRGGASGAAMLAPLIVVIVQCILLAQWNATVLNIEDTLITVNKLIENAKISFGNDDMELQGALAFLFSTQGINTEDEDELTTKRLRAAQDLPYDEETIQHDNPHAVYLRTNLEAAMLKVRNARAAWLRDKVLQLSPDDLGASREDLAARILPRLRLLDENNLMTKRTFKRGARDHEGTLKALAHDLAAAFKPSVFNLGCCGYVKREKFDFAVQRCYWELDGILDFHNRENRALTDPASELFWPDNHQLTCGWDTVMQAEYSKQSWKSTKTDDDIWDKLGKWDKFERFMAGYTYSFLRDNVLGEPDDRAFAGLIARLVILSIILVIAFVLYAVWAAFGNAMDSQCDAASELAEDIDQVCTAFVIGGSEIGAARETCSARGFN
ncbi:unnamed protein product [Pedinophyceae sp. YPF-701]|nr:unnamed protein product [Pedinophyceae sp. YPF-701]